MNSKSNLTGHSVEQWMVVTEYQGEQQRSLGHPANEDYVKVSPDCAELPQIDFLALGI